MPTLNAFSVVATDMAATLAFYRALGLDIAEGADAEPHAEVVLDGGVRLMFDSLEIVRSLYPEWQPTGPSSFGMAMAFECASPADVDATYERMVGRGHRGEKEPWDAFWGQRYGVLLDPDGNPVDLYAAL